MIQQSAIAFPPIKSSLVENTANNFTFTIQPLLPGYGHTLGNSIRRVLLSSVPGFAVTRITINDITHEYQAIDGVVEDAMTVVLNLKLLRVKLLGDDDKVLLKLTKNKQGEVRASEFKSDSKIEVVNSDLYVCYLSKDIPLNIEIEVSRGVGYLPVEKINFVSNLNPQHILVDALFSPVQSVKVDVQKVRVGDRTDYDKLEINFETDSSVTGSEVVSFVLDFINDLYEKIRSSLSVTAPEIEKPAKANKKDVEEVKIASELDLPEDLVQILEKNDVKTKAELDAKIDEIEDFAGITKKHVKLIKELLKNS
ncbi:MAG: hypothetical protein WCK98_04905 [bacterium]